MGSTGWEESWEIYEGAADSGRAIVLVDLGAKLRAPLASHPVRLQVRVKLLAPRPDGLRGAEETEALYALEDKLVAALRASADARFVARVVAYGYTEFFFYVPATERECGARADALVGGAAPYHLEWFSEDDPQWTEYGALYPNRYALQSIANRRLQQHMEEQGDNLALPREVDHAASFPSREQAEAATQALTAAGFRVSAPTPLDGERKGWQLEFHRTETCDADAPDLFVFEVLKLIDPHGGDYDGWGSTLQRAQA
jgi:regulator of RNase E activity RraB